MAEVEKVYREWKEEEADRVLKRCQSCGYGVRAKGGLNISDPGQVVIGNNVHIGANVIMVTDGGLTIGDNTVIEDEVVIVTRRLNFHGNALPFDRKIPEPVFIGRNVYIGQRALINPGVKIGDGAIISPGTIVTEDVPPLAIVRPAPSRVVTYRDKGHYARLESRRRYADGSGRPLSEKEVRKFRRTGQDPSLTLFFVVTTGKRGSKVISDILSRHPRIICRWGLRPQLQRLSLDLVHQRKSARRVKEELVAIYRNSSVFPDGLYGEADPALWNLIPFLAEIFPQSKFLWLLWDGRDTIALREGAWLEEGIKADLLDGHRFPKASGEMSPFERSCWVWALVTQRVEENLQKLPPERWMVVRMEELEEQIPKVWEFLGVEQRGLQGAVTEDVPKGLWQSWGTKEREIFERWCNDLMARWYPGWKDGDGTWLPVPKSFGR